MSRRHRGVCRPPGCSTDEFPCQSGVTVFLDAGTVISSYPTNARSLGLECICPLSRLDLVGKVLCIALAPRLPLQRLELQGRKRIRKQNN